MKKIVLYIILSGIGFTGTAQTWQRIFSLNTCYSVDETSDGSFICAFDSMGNSYIVKLGSYGQRLSAIAPVIRTNGESIFGIAEDPYGGFAICGDSPDTTGTVGANGFFARVDTNGIITDTLIFPPGINSGSARCLRVSPDSNYVVSTMQFNGAGSANTAANQIFYPAIPSWTTPGLAGLSINSVEVDELGQTLLATYNGTSATLASVTLTDAAGNLHHTFSVADSILGGSLVFASTVGLGTGNRYGFGCNLSPFSQTNDVVYFTCLDTAFNNNWIKILDWGIPVSLNSIVPTADSGFALLLNMDDSIRLHRMNAAGDSLWTKAYGGLRHSHAYSMRGTDDGGFIICGTTDSIPLNNFAYVFKVDADGNFLPVIITASVTSFCPGDTISLTAPPGFSNYQWSNGDTNSTALITQQGDYWLTVTDNLGMQYSSDTVQLTQYNVGVPVISQVGQTLNSTPALYYQWYDSLGIFSGDTLQSFTPPASGEYFVLVTDSNGCMASSLGFTFIATGISDPGSQDLKTIQSGKNIFLHASSAMDKIEVFAITGEKVLVYHPGSTSASLNLSAMSSGIYILVVTGKNNEWKKIISVRD